MKYVEWLERHKDEIEQNEKSGNILPIGMNDVEALSILFDELWKKKHGYIAISLSSSQANTVMVEDILEDYLGKKFLKKTKKETEK